MHVLMMNHILLAATHVFINRCFYFWPQSIIALWLVVVSDPAEGSRLS